MSWLGLVPRGLVAAGGVVNLHMRLQVVAVHVEAQRFAVVLDRLCLKAHATADKFLFVIHGCDAIEHVVARVVDVAENLLFEGQHACLVEIASTGEEIFAVGVFAAERPGDKVTAVVEALAWNKVVALLVPTGGMDARDVAALALAERFGSYAGERFAGTAQAVEFRELLKAALFGGPFVFIERERRRAERMRAVGAEGNVGVAGVVGNAAEIYAAGAVEVGVFHFVDGGGVRRDIVSGAGRGGFGAIAGVLGARCSRFEPGDQVRFVVGAVGALALLLG